MERTQEHIKILDDIDKLIEYSNSGRVELYDTKYRLILSAKNETELDELVKTEVKPPKTYKKVYLFNYLIKKNIKNKNPFQLGLDIVYITPDLNVSIRDENKELSDGKVITWSYDELIKYGFKRSYLLKIIRAIDGRKISLSPLSTENITTIMNLKK
jgi:hypothetical protein